MELSELFERIDIVDYISQYVELTESNDEYWGISPFTFPPERTPSFSVRRENGTFYDFSSGIGGNVFTFVKYFNKCSGREAVEILKKYAGIEGEIAQTHSKLAAVETFKRFLPTKRTVKASKSVILPDNYMDRYEERPEKLQIWLDEGISEAALKHFQVKYDAFSDRLVYPVRNMQGKIVNIGGRALDPCWKEKNQRKYCYFFPWGMLDTLYGLAENMDFVLQKREVIIFEGCKSVLLANSWGIQNCCALLTSHLNPHQLKILARLGCRVVFALDKDIDIRKDHNINKLKQYVNVEYLHDTNGLLEDKDAPVDKGLEVFQKLYESKKRLC